MNNGLLQLLDSNGIVLAQATMNANGIQTYAFTLYTCDSNFQGGGWVLVRRVKQGSTTWHPTTDNLAGTQPAYGTYGSDTSDATFGIPYSSWVKSETEFLLATGARSGAIHAQASFYNQRFEIAGDKTKWLMTTWDAINNNNIGYAAVRRNVTRSSYSSSPC
jgi:hypothetical protein